MGLWILCLLLEASSLQLINELFEKKNIFIISIIYKWFEYVYIFTGARQSCEKAEDMISTPPSSLQTTTPRNAQRWVVCTSQLLLLFLFLLFFSTFLSYDAIFFPASIIAFWTIYFIYMYIIRDKHSCRQTKNPTTKWYNNNVVSATYNYSQRIALACPQNISFWSMIISLA